MTVIKQLLLLLLVLAIAKYGKAQDDFCGLNNTAFKSGERIYFKAYYNMGRLWVGAGEAVFSVKEEKLNGRMAYHVIGDGKTLKSYEWFYKVRDRYETWI